MAIENKLKYYDEVYKIAPVPFLSGITASRAVMLALLAVTILFLLLRLIYHDWHAATFASAILTALFFSYGHVYDKVAETWDILHLTTLLLSLWSLLAVLALFSNRTRPMPGFAELR